MEVWKGEKRLSAGNVSLHLNLDVNFTTAVEGLKSENGSPSSRSARCEAGGRKVLDNTMSERLRAAAFDLMLYDFTLHDMLVHTILFKDNTAD